METEITRRKFIHKVAIGAAGVSVTTLLEPVKSPARAAGANAPPDYMPMRALGQTGRKVCLFSLGGQGLLEIPGHTDEAVAIINRAIDLGVNYLDTSWWYGHGSSEQYYGEVMKTRRKEIYLATKSSERTYDGAMRQLKDTREEVDALVLALRSLKQI